MLVQYIIPLPILLIVKGYCDGICLEEVGESRQGRNSIHDAIGTFAPEL
jgi:hypothetical protein